MILEDFYQTLRRCRYDPRAIKSLYAISKKLGIQKDLVDTYREDRLTAMTMASHFKVYDPKKGLQISFVEV